MAENETLALHAAALDQFAEHVHQVGPDQWTAATPCTDWNVRDLVNHMAVEQLWVPPLLAGDKVAELGEQFGGDQLGDDPVAIWDEASAEARAAFAEPLALARTVHLSYGDSPAESYCLEMAVDAIVHSWDLARGIGANDVLPVELAEFALDQVEPQARMLAASGLFADPVPVPQGADAQTRLLGLTGRST
ncbi:TIGR03086 family metal-binding protein [Streptomyces sp. B8F3]|uniref:TIGR03086 family metal-binding protein n=1 Tax=unclassified Streptomyces TaxID=2593676 RepID=UPI00325C937D